VPNELVAAVLKAAGWAPSAHNSQPWRFLLLSHQELKRKLALAMAEAWLADLRKDGIEIKAEKFQERVERFTNAPVLLLACMTMDGLRTFPDVERQNCERDLAMQSFGAAVQNLLLTAHSLGLGACWYCAPAFCKPKVRQIVGIPDTVEPQAFVILGYSAESPSEPLKKKLVDFCFVDVWGQSFRI
jgi:F420 biosynthesis protein FbiB-like protein